jgi:hypothetical protein
MNSNDGGHNMRVTVAELRALADKFFGFLEDFGHDPAEISNDYYWRVYPPDLYNPYEKPTHFGLGQLMEEWPDLQKILYEDYYPDLVSLGWFAALLRAISDELMPEPHDRSEHEEDSPDLA